MFKRSLLAALSFAVLLSPVRAADVVKTSAFAPSSFLGGNCTPTTCTGLYVGGGLGGVGTNLDVIGNGLKGSAFAGGMLPTAKIGYLYAKNDWLFGVEATASYQMDSAVTLANAVSGNQSGILFTQGVKFGGNFAKLLGVTPAAPISIPPSLANAVISVYAQAGSAEHKKVGGFVSGMYSGAGVLFDTGPHSFVDIDYKNIQYGATQSGAASFNMQNVITASWNYKF